MAYDQSQYYFTYGPFFILGLFRLLEHFRHSVLAVLAYTVGHVTLAHLWTALVWTVMVQRASQRGYLPLNSTTLTIASAALSINSAALLVVSANPFASPQTDHAVRTVNSGANKQSHSYNSTAQLANCTNPSARKIGSCTELVRQNITSYTGRHN